MKKFICIIMVMCVIMTMSACSMNSSVSYTFGVNTGDSVKIELDTSDEYSLSSDVPFVISCDGKELSYGVFIVGDGYDKYLELIESDENAYVIDSGEKNGYAYTMWNYNDVEWNYAIHVSDATTVILGNNTSEESAHACFDRMTVSVINTEE